MAEEKKKGGGNSNIEKLFKSFYENSKHKELDTSFWRNLL